MQTLRRVLQIFLGIEALGSVALFLLSLASTMAMRRALGDEDVPESAYRLVMAVALVFPLLGSLPAVAWWTLKKQKRSARRWALAASILNVLVLLSGIDIWRHVGATPSLIVYAACGVAGIAGLIGFWGNEKSAPKRARIAGDGTSNLKDYAAQIIAAAIIWVSMDGWHRWASSHHLSYPGFVVFLVQMELAVLLTTFGHELGHLVAGWVSGKILRVFQVGPFRWAIRNGVWRFDFNLRKFYGGAVAMVTPDLINVRSRKAFSLIGGPVASLVMASIFIVAAMLTPGHSWQQYWMFLSMMATFSLSAFVVNLIPLKPESSYSDGAQLYQVVTNGPWARVHFAFAMVTSSLVSPVRPRDFDLNVLNRAADAVPTGERGLLLRLFICTHYLDTGEIPKALVSLEEAEALYGESKFEKTQDICAEFAFINAFYKRDLATAEMWSRRIEAVRKVDPDADYWRAQTALHWLRGELEEASAAWDRGNALALKLPAAGTYEFTRSCFTELRAELDKPLQTTPPPLQGQSAMFRSAEYDLANSLLQET
jgi:hypothetical protein